MQKQQLVGTLGLLWKRVDKITSLDTKIDNEGAAIASKFHQCGVGRAQVT